MKSVPRPTYLKYYLNSKHILFIFFMYKMVIQLISYVFNSYDSRWYTGIL